MMPNARRIDEIAALLEAARQETPHDPDAILDAMLPHLDEEEIAIAVWAIAKVCAA